MSNWPTKKLGEVVKIQNGFAFKSSEYVDSGFFVMRITNVQDGFIELNNPKFIKASGKNFENFILHEGDILMSLTGNVGRVGAIEKDHLPAVLNQRVARITILDKNRMDWRYLFHFLKSPSFISRVIDGGHGMAQKNVSTKDIEAFEIPLPPLAEQKKIVARLEKLLAKVKEANRLRVEAQDFTQNLLSAELHKIFEEGKKKGWKDCNIGDEKVMKMTSGGTPARGNKRYYNGNIPWLKSGELNDNIDILDSDEHIIEEAIKNSSAKIFPKNTVLLAMYGATAGKLGILKNSATTNQAVAGITCNEDKLNYKYLFYCLVKIRNQIIAKAWGGAQPNLSQTIIKKFKIPLPPLSEQKKIVARLDALSEKIKKLQAHQESTKNDLVALEQSILHQAFKN